MGWTSGKKLDEKHKQKIKEATVEYWETHKPYNLGRKWTTEHKNKIGQACKKYWSKKESRDNQSKRKLNTKRNYSHSIETREKISQALTGIKRTVTFRNHLKKCVCKHHIYLEENSDKIIYLSNKDHSKLHNRAYEYIYTLLGKSGIDNYIKWCEEEYRITILKKKEV
jgi:hypothetical protein